MCDENDVSIEDLNLTFDDIEEDALIRSLQASSAATAAVATTATTTMNHVNNTNTANNDTTVARVDDDDEDDVCCKKSAAAASASGPDVDKERIRSDNDHDNDDEYILGTLIVRVVAARDLEPINRHGLGNLFFGNNQSSSSNNRNGTANPYASVRFGNTIQRTSEVRQTTDPVWPRGETMYMDVTHPAWKVTVTDEDGELNDDDDSMEKKPAAKKSVNEVSKKSINEKKLLKKDSSNSSSNTTTSSSRNMQQYVIKTPPKPLLTVAVFHAPESGKALKYPNKQGDSDDVFLGMAIADLTQVITGKERSFDEWIPLTGSRSEKATVRIVCEYESSDSTPHPGDKVKFTDYCHPKDLYPAIQAGREYKVEQVDGDDVIISWTSPEGWLLTYQVHRYMLIVLNRHHSIVNRCQDELASIRERLAFSPAAHAVQETVARLPDEGLINVGVDAIRNGLSLLGRWKNEGLEKTIEDINYVTNWDGSQNPSTANSLETDPNCVSDTNAGLGVATLDDAKPAANNSNDISDNDVNRLILENLPNMPSCPITGEPMRDPVVAADGHTYERTAIARWLKESNKSPLTGAVLAHKELVSNYMLLSSLREAALLKKDSSSSQQVNPNYPVARLDGGSTDDVTLEININD